MFNGGNMVYRTRFLGHKARKTHAATPSFFSAFNLALAGVRYP